ncbi:unnamed protein product [Calypogeia fissa]
MTARLPDWLCCLTARDTNGLLTGTSGNAGARAGPRGGPGTGAGQGRAGQGRAEVCEGIEQKLWHAEQSRATGRRCRSQHPPIFIITAMEVVSLSILLAAADVFRDCHPACAAAAFALAPHVRSSSCLLHRHHHYHVLLPCSLPSVQCGTSVTRATGSSEKAREVGHKLDNTDDLVDKTHPKHRSSVDHLREDQLLELRGPL